MAPHRIRFGSIPSNDLVRVKGGASRVTSRSSSGNDQLTTMLTQITSSIQNLSGNKSSQSDPMTMMMMMMMMMGGGPGGGGGGGGQVAAAPPPPLAPPPGPVVNISTRIQH
jgi:hypothetical protein